MFVIEAVNAEGKVADVFISDTIGPDGDTLLHPLKLHFANDHIHPFHASGFETQEAAQAEIGEAVGHWSSEEYAKYEGQVSSARIVALDAQGNAGGYQITDTTDEEVKARWYATYKDAFRDYIALIRKKVKHRGETPRIVRAEGSQLL